MDSVICVDSILGCFVRMSLDLSSSPLSTNLTSLPSLDTGPLAISAITNDSSDKVVADVKSFGATDQNAQPGTLKRVQSDAMLIAADDASGILASSRRSSSDDDYLEEVLTRLGCEALLDFSFTDEDGVKKVCVFSTCATFYDWETS